MRAINPLLLLACIYLWNNNKIKWGGMLIAQSSLNVSCDSLHDEILII